MKVNQKPERRLAKNMVKVWFMKETLSLLIGLPIIAILFFISEKYDWANWLQITLIIGSILYLIITIIGFIRPYFLHKNWRFDADEHYLQLKYGAFVEVHTLVPMTKIQAVSTNEGPLLRKYGLCTITVDTMGSTHTIPGLLKEEAIELRHLIATYAKLKEVA